MNATGHNHGFPSKRTTAQQIADYYAEQSRKCREQAATIAELERLHDQAWDFIYEHCLQVDELERKNAALKGQLEDNAETISEYRQQADDANAGVRQMEEQLATADETILWKDGRIVDLEQRLATADAVVERLPKNAEGDSITPGINQYVVVSLSGGVGLEVGHIQIHLVGLDGVVDNFGNRFGCYQLYSTESAAQEAAEGSGS